MDPCADFQTAYDQSVIDHNAALAQLAVLQGQLAILQGQITTQNGVVAQKANIKNACYQALAYCRQQNP